MHCFHSIIAAQQKSFTYPLDNFWNIDRELRWYKTLGDTVSDWSARRTCVMMTTAAKQQWNSAILKSWRAITAAVNIIAQNNMLYVLDYLIY